MTADRRLHAALPAALFALAAVVLLLAFAFFWRQWGERAAVGRLLSSLRGSADAAGTAGDRIREIRRQGADLSKRMAEQGAELRALETERMTMSAEESQALFADVLTLASECGLSVEDVSTQGSGGEGRASPGVPDGEPAAVRPRPLGALAGQSRMVAQIRCRATYGQISDFYLRMGGLRKAVLPVLFDIRWGSEGAAPEAGSVSGERLSMTVTLVL